MMSDPIEFPDNTPLTIQVKALADMLMSEFSEHFTRSEGAIEMAIRLLREQKAALAVAPDPAPDDAEFETAAHALITAAWGAAQTWHGDNPDDEEHELRAERESAALKHVLALHRQARHAGLRELRGRVLAMASAADDDESKYDQGAIDMAMRTVDEIDALLKEATYDQPK